MKLLHLADIHLDRAFTSAGARDGDRRRAELREAFVRALNVGVERGVDAVCLAGDVYEHETVREDTAAFLRTRLSEIEVPVLVTPGNHDPYVPGSVWQRTAWPESVHLFTRDSPQPFELGDVTVWGAAFTARHCSTSCLDGWHTPADGRTHLLLLHAALTGEQWADDPAHRPVTRAGIRATGIAYAMLGHFHAGRADELICYPGSPEPLGFGERSGRHAAAILEVTEAGVGCELVDVARRVYSVATVRVDGAHGSDEIETAVASEVAVHAGESLEITLEGEVAAGCEVAPRALEERFADGLRELRIRDRTRPAYDLRSLAEEPSVRGRFVARLLDSDEPHAREALLAGLRALDGREDLVA
ncbi:MAG: metallophosphoesterase family protein [Gaiellales bacterium]